MIVDDIIDTGGTLAAGARTVMEEGASEVYAVATHGIFSGNAFQTLAGSPLSGILVTDTVPLAAGAPPDLIRVLTVQRHPHGLDPADLHRRLCD